MSKGLDYDILGAMSEVGADEERDLLDIEERVAGNIQEIVDTIFKLEELGYVIVFADPMTVRVTHKGFMEFWKRKRARDKRITALREKYYPSAEAL